MSAIAERTHILIHKSTINEAGSGLTKLTHPENLPEWHLYCQAITFILAIESVQGAPSAWELQALFELRQPDAPGGKTWAFVADRWAALQKEQAENMIVEEVGWYGGAHAAPMGGAAGIVATNADSLPIIVRRTIKPAGSMPRLVLVPKFTGGTSPTLTVSLTATPQV